MCEIESIRNSIPHFACSYVGGAVTYVVQSRYAANTTQVRSGKNIFDGSNDDAGVGCGTLLVVEDGERRKLARNLAV